MDFRGAHNEKRTPLKNSTIRDACRRFVGLGGQYRSRIY